MIEREETNVFEIDGKQLKFSTQKLDIAEEKKERAKQLAVEALSKHTVEKEISEYIKYAFDQEFSPSWQVVVGKDFAVSLTHESENFIFFSMESIYFLIFKV